MKRKDVVRLRFKWHPLISLWEERVGLYVLLKADITVLMSMASVSNEITFDFKKKAHQWCNQYLGGSWRNISIDDFSIQVLGYELLCFCFL